MIRLLSRCLLITFVCALEIPQHSFTQMVNDGNQLGLPPQGTFSGSDFDLVSFQNGNLHITIPIQSLPQRNGKTLAISYVYDIPTWSLIGDYSGGNGAVWDVEQEGDEVWGAEFSPSPGNAILLLHQSSSRYRHVPPAGNARGAGPVCLV